MMRTHYSLPLLGATLLAGGLCVVFHPHLLGEWLSHLQGRFALVLIMVSALFTAHAANAQSLTFTTAGGIAVGGSGTAYTGAFGNMNGLGVGTVPAGLTAVPMSNGTLYYTPINMRVTVGGLSTAAWVTAYVSTTGAPVGTALVPYACPYNLSCTTSANYSPLSTSAGSPTTIIASPGVANNTTATIGVGFFLPDNNGVTAHTGASNVTITFTVTNNGIFGWGIGIRSANITLTLSTNVQTAVSLTLSTAPSGLTIAPAGTTDYSMNFGNVNALGIGAGPSLTTTTVPGGTVYSTPYLLNPAFSNFTSTTATIKVAATMNFVHPAVLTLQDASAGGGPFTALSATPRTITTAAGNRSSITRYLGLFVSNVNGATSYRGSDNATLTFTLTVP